MNKPANTWKFGVGLPKNVHGEFFVTVTVKATGHWSAVERAQVELDRRIKAGRYFDPRMGKISSFLLTLIEARHVPRKRKQT